MFQLSLVDHSRLSFGSVVSAFEGHTEAAARLARWSWYAKVAILTLLGLAAAASSAAAVRGGFYTITAAALSAVGFAATTAGRLWLICEKYRALLTEIHDQLIDVPAIAQRRDALLKESSELFVQAPPADRATYEIARKTLGGSYSEQQIDQFLPLALRRPSSATT